MLLIVRTETNLSVLEKLFTAATRAGDFFFTTFWYNFTLWTVKVCFLSMGLHRTVEDLETQIVMANLPIWCHNNDSGFCEKVQESEECEWITDYFLPWHYITASTAIALGSAIGETFFYFLWTIPVQSDSLDNCWITFLILPCAWQAIRYQVL